MNEPDASQSPESDPAAEIASLRAELAHEQAINRLLQEANIATRVSTSFRQACEAVLKVVCNHLACAVGHAYFPHTDFREPLSEIWLPLDGQEPFAGSPSSPEAGTTNGAPLLGAVRPGQSPWWVENVSAEPDLCCNCGAALPGIGAGFAVPVTADGVTLAVLEFLRAEPSPANSRVLEALATLARLLEDLHERLRRESDPQTREEHLRAMIDAGPSCIKLLAADGVLLEINDAGAVMVDASHPSQLVGHLIESLIAPEHREAFRAFHQKVIGGWTGSMEFEIIGLRGTHRWIETHAAPLRAPNGDTRHLAISVDITERKRAEEVIRYIAAHAHCILWHADVEDRSGDGLNWKVRVSDEQAAQRFFPLEMPPGQSYAQCWYEARIPEDRKRCDARADAHVRSGQDYLQEFQATDGAGKTRWLREDVHVEPVGPGKWRVVGICTDVTAQRGAQAALRKREELLRQVLDNLPVGVWVVDADGQIVRANPAGERIWAGSGSDGNRSRHLVDPAEIHYEPLGPDAHAVTRAITRGEISLNEEIAISCADGSRKTILNSVVPLRNADASIAGAIVVNEDITERMRAERRDLAFQALGAQLNAALSPQDAARTILSVANELVGWDSCWLDTCDLETMTVQPVILIDEVNGELQEVASPTRILSPTSLAARAIREGPLLIDRPRDSAPRHDEPEPVRFGNVDRPSEAIMVVPIRLGSRAVGALSIQSYTPKAYDASDLDTLLALADYCAGALERAQSEEQRRSLEQQLLQSQKMDAIGRLAGGVAHDFNNMLGVISGYSELMLMRGIENSADRMAIEEIRAASNRATGLTSQLLAFSRKSIVQPEILRMNEMVESMERMLQRLIGEDVRLTCRLDPWAGCVRVDRSQLDQVLLNLAVNARDAMPMGGVLQVATQAVSVAADMIPELQPGDYVLLTVSDTGSGMTEETITRIWEPFFTTKPKGKGTGLGLATVYGIVKQHGGSVSVESRPGEGSVFRIYLPHVAPVEVSSMQPSTDEAKTGGRETILVVEDEGMLRRLISLVLRQSGYHVLEAADGAEALRHSEDAEGPIHLLLADVVIPGGISGRMVAQQIEAQRPDTRTLMMSGYTDDAVLRHGVESGSAPFIQKPFAPIDLIRKVQEVLSASCDASAEIPV